MATTGKTHSHFIVKLLAEGGADPAKELRNILEQCRGDKKATAWFASSFPGEKFQRAGNSICVIFRQTEGEQKVEAIVARIMSQEHRGSPPIDSAARKFYAPWRDRRTHWWELGGQPANEKFCDAVLVEFETLDMIPGQSWDKARKASVVFTKGNCFSGWAFSDDFEPLKWLRSLTGTRPER